MAALKVTYKDPPPAESRGHGIRARTLQQIKQIAASIKEFGFISPVLIDDADGIIAGMAGSRHKTHRHERRLHRARRPSDPAQIRAYVIAVFAERLRAGCPREPVIAAWGIGRDGQKVLLHLVSGSKEDTETVPRVLPGYARWQIRAASARRPPKGSGRRVRDLDRPILGYRYPTTNGWVADPRGPIKMGHSRFPYAPACRASCSQLFTASTMRATSTPYEPRPASSAPSWMSCASLASWSLHRRARRHYGFQEGDQGLNENIGAGGRESNPRQQLGRPLLYH